MFEEPLLNAATDFHLLWCASMAFSGVSVDVGEEEGTCPTCQLWYVYLAGHIIYVSNTCPPCHGLSYRNPIHYPVPVDTSRTTTILLSSRANFQIELEHIILLLFEWCTCTTPNELYN